jgi:hypothetical protein
VAERHFQLIEVGTHIHKQMGIAASGFQVKTSLQIAASGFSKTVQLITSCLQK